MRKSIVSSLLVVALGAGIAWLTYWTGIAEKMPFRLGLDLKGGSHLVYQVDLSGVSQSEHKEKLDVLRRVLEDRVNGSDVSGVLGVGENVVQVQGNDKIIVELPGITDPVEANKKIGKTPQLEFKEEDPNYKPGKDQEIVITPKDVVDGKLVIPTTFENIDLDKKYRSTGLTGEYLKRADVQFDPQGQAYIQLTFTPEGAKLFAEITERNVGKTLAVYLDGVLTQAPVVEQKITGGTAVITGVTPEEARERAKELNLGALPVPISLVSQDTVGPSLGADAIDAGVTSGIIGFIAIMVILVLWYRLPGLIASISLLIYSIVTIALVKFLSVTLTAPGIAGLVISLGMAVDANILIFERMKEELQRGANVVDALATGFDRAWLSIRDGNVSSLISAFFLYLLGTTLIKSFALTFGLGVLVSMISAIIVSKVFLKTASFLVGRWPVFFKTGVSR